MHVDIHAIFGRTEVDREKVRQKRMEEEQRRQREELEKKLHDEERKRDAEAAFQIWLERKKNQSVMKGMANQVH